MATLTGFHGYQDSVRWRLAPPSGAVEVEGSGVERTRGAPSTATRVWEAHAEAINRSARTWRVPCALIVATICTESGGKADAVRLEPGYVSDEATPHKVSPGLTQTLISTARETLQVSCDRAWLLAAANSIEAGTAYIAGQARQTGLDPPLVAAAYNAGRLAYEGSPGNRWKLRQYPRGTGAHCDRFVRFFNDAVFVLERHAVRPVLGMEGLVGVASAPMPRRNPPGPSPSPSGAPWVRRFPGSRSVEDLEGPFRARVRRFLAALDEAGARVTIAATLRPPERAYLMHWSWRIARQGDDPRRVPPREGVEIEWWHGGEAASRQAAEEMVLGYGIGGLGVPPALSSRHIEGKAIDMAIAWDGVLRVRQADGVVRAIASAPKDGTNAELIAVGKTYGVVHFHNVEKDRPHWSSDGR